jgi:hypothetical protein
VPKNQLHAKKIIGRRHHGVPSMCMDCLQKKGRRVYRAKKAILAKRGTPLKKRIYKRAEVGTTPLIGFLPTIVREKKGEINTT